MRFDLLLTYIVMPEMDGRGRAQHVAAVAPEMRVMFITGFAAVTLKAGKAVPQAKVLSKPFHLRDLVLEVDRMFGPNSATGLAEFFSGYGNSRLHAGPTPANGCLPVWACSSVVDRKSTRLNSSP